MKKKTSNFKNTSKRKHPSISNPPPQNHQNRNYLSVIEVANYTHLSVTTIHRHIKNGKLPAYKSPGGQYRLQLQDIQPLRPQQPHNQTNHNQPTKPITIHTNHTQQTIITADSRDTTAHIPDNTIHLAITSPPYFNAKMYTQNPNDLGNIHNLDQWLTQIEKTWRQTFRTLQPGRKFFLNIMNLPIPQNKTFRTLNLVGKNIDLCEHIGFTFKRDIIWHKTNGVRAHFGTYPNPGGILLNNMHETILEFEKPTKNPAKKYTHITPQQRQASKLDKQFWLTLKNSDVWLIKPEKSGPNRQHAAPFPIELPERLIRAYSYVGETILDPFLGSGTTLVAAAIHRRNGIGIEINPHYTQIAQQRLTQISNQPPTKKTTP